MKNSPSFIVIILWNLLDIIVIGEKNDKLSFVFLGS